MAEENTKTIRLKVAEAVQDDVNKGIVRMDSHFMKEIGISGGDFVQIEGKRKTYAIVDRAYPGDIGLNILRMDGPTRRNAHTSIGDVINISKAAVGEARTVTIAPAREGIIIKASPMLFKQGLLGRVLIRGDLVSLGGTLRRRRTMSQSPVLSDIFPQDRFLGFGFGDLKFVVVSTNPSRTPLIITEDTQVDYSSQAVELEEDTAFEVSYEDIGGLGNAIGKVREMIELPLKHPEIFERLGVDPPKGVLLHGPPGTGKTLLAKAVASETTSHFVVINGPEIMSKFYGESEGNLRKKFEDAEKNSPSIIFIDEIDAIAAKREEVHGEVERRVVGQLLSLMDGLKSRGRVVVIAASNRPNALDPALRRPGRFDREIEIGVPDKKGRLEIFKIHTRSMPLAKDVKMTKLAEVTHGFVGADISLLAKEAALIRLRRVLPDLNLDEKETISKELLDKLYITQKDLIEALKVVRPSAMREVLIETPDVTWDDVGGLGDIKDKLIESVEWPLKRPLAFKRLGIQPPKGILLYGPPGTGKTLLAKAVANETEANFILVNGPSMLSKWVGESERAVREIFRKARQAAPCIIFFDEIDSIAQRRGSSMDDSSRGTERVVNQLLTEMDGLESLNDVIIIAATNRPDILDTALLRPGRFDRILLTPAPDEKARENIFMVHTKDMPLKDVEISDLAKKTSGYAGADIQAVCREAAMIALREDIKIKEVSKTHFDAAMQIVRPSVTEDIEKAYADLAKHFSSARGKQMKEERPIYFS